MGRSHAQAVRPVLRRLSSSAWGRTDSLVAPQRQAAKSYNACLDLHTQSTSMENIDQRYLVQQNKRTDEGKKPPVFAKVMRGNDGKFEGASFIRNKEKATVMTVADAEEVIRWAARKKGNAHEYDTKIICVGQ